ncbi:hypothetical protein GCM10023405_31350 [Streptomonospora salina]
MSPKLDVDTGNQSGTARSAAYRMWGRRHMLSRSLPGGVPSVSVLELPEALGCEWRDRTRMIKSGNCGIYLMSW